MSGYFDVSGRHFQESTETMITIYGVEKLIHRGKNMPKTVQIQLSFIPGRHKKLIDPRAGTPYGHIARDAEKCYDFHEPH